MCADQLSSKEDQEVKRPERGEQVTQLNTAQAFLFEEDKSDMNVLGEKPLLSDSERQQNLKFIIHFLQQLLQSLCNFHSFLRQDISLQIVFLSSILSFQLNRENTVHHQSLQWPRNTRQFFNGALQCFSVSSAGLKRDNTKPLSL